MTPHRITIRLLLTLMLALAAITIIAQEDSTDETATVQDGDERYVGSIPAPDFPDGLDWINTEAPLTLEDLNGKIIILDFWTYGCINCIHMIPVMRQLQEKYTDELVVLSVHSAKFASEGETENIEQIVERYGIDHPVINDNNFQVWRTYGVSAWPTFVIIDPRGNAVTGQSGEVPYEAFDQYIGAMIEYYDALDRGDLNRDSLEFILEEAAAPNTLLRFPGKVRVDEDGKRLFIADTNHHRIVIADLLTYDVLDVVGAGTRGYTDGDFTTAQFDQPQGMALVGDTLYVADVNNHTIRAIDLTNQTVTTVAGTGTMGRGIASFDTVIPDPLAYDIRSPWDVAYNGENLLYIAMAGTHQIWQLNLETNELQAAVGNGFEAQVSTTLAESELAQPSGLYFVEGNLYFADSESSTVRVANIPADTVDVIAGTTANDLFDSGDMDGELGDSRLQHALGVTGDANGTIYIADTYNNAIKTFNPETTITTALVGLGGLGAYVDGDAETAQFDEPGGLDYYDNKLFVADTNNHVIRVIDLNTTTVSTLQFPNPEALAIADRVTVINSVGEIATSRLDAVTLAEGESSLTVNLTLPDGYKLNPLVDSFILLDSDRNTVSVASDTLTVADTTLSVPMTLTTGETELRLEMTIFYCEAENEAFCLIEDVRLIQPITITTDDAVADTLTLDYTITLPAGLN